LGFCRRGKRKGPRPAKRRAVGFEPLEERTLLSVSSKDLLLAYLAEHPPAGAVRTMQSSRDFCGPIQQNSLELDYDAGQIYVPSGGVDSSQFSPASGVRYANGDGLVTADDLGIGVTRTYSAQTWWARDQHLGPGWQLNDVPAFAEESGVAVVSFGPQSAYWFDDDNGDYTARYGAKQTLAGDSGDFVFADTDGTVYRFQDGLFQRSTTVGGATVVAGYDSYAITSLQYTAAGATQPYRQLLFTYDENPGSLGRMTGITLQSYDTFAEEWVSISRVTYTYCRDFDLLSFDPAGIYGELKSVALAEMFNYELR
jgi:hypothetical protein